jgi:PIF1-like helicase
VRLLDSNQSVAQSKRGLNGHRGAVLPAEESAEGIPAHFAELPRQHRGFSLTKKSGLSIQHARHSNCNSRPLQPAQRRSAPRLRAHRPRRAGCVADRHFFLQGAGRTGKTFLYRALYGHRAAGKCILCVASSGIAATLLPRGRTAYSQFKIPLSLHEWSSCDIKLESCLGRQLPVGSLLLTRSQ